MPSFFFTSSVAAGATYTPLDTGDWMYKYLPYAAIVEIFQNATATGIVGSVTFGSDTIVQESPVSAGGTAAVIPSRLNYEPLTEKANAGDLVKLNYRNTTAGAITVNGMITITRAG